MKFTLGKVRKVSIWPIWFRGRLTRFVDSGVVLCPVFVPGNVLQYLALKSGCSEFWISAACSCLIILVTWRAIQCQLGAQSSQQHLLKLSRGTTSSPQPNHFFLPGLQLCLHQPRLKNFLSRTPQWILWTAKHVQVELLAVMLRVLYQSSPTYLGAWLRIAEMRWVTWEEHSQVD